MEPPRPWSVPEIDLGPSTEYHSSSNEWQHPVPVAVGRGGPAALIHPLMEQSNHHPNPPPHRRETYRGVNVQARPLTFSKLKVKGEGGGGADENRKEKR